MKKHVLGFLFIACCFPVSAQTILGVDVSSYEGSINWTQVKAAGYTFAFAKATEGITLTDSYFVGNQTNGTAAGMIMGAYHFAHPENNSATAEANYFLSVAGTYIKACHLPPVLDMEDPPSGPSLSTYFTSAQLTTWIQTWMTTVKNATGISPIIYIGPSNASFVNSSLNTWGLWIDDYNSSPTAPPPNIGVWTNWEFKQYSWTGTVPGISVGANTDMDVFHGTLNQFNTLVGCNAVLASFTSSIQSVCPGGSVSFTDQSTTTGSLTGWSWTFAGGTPSTSTLQNPVVTYNTPGTYSVKEVVTSTVGADSVVYTGYINVAGTGSLPLTEDFQSAVFPPAGWAMHIPNTYDSIWHLCPYTGYNSSQCMYFPANCGQTSNISGERQQVYTAVYNFSTAPHPALWFDVAYEPSHVPAYSDTLVVSYSSDCGSTWHILYTKGGMTLCTTGSTTGAGTDTAGSHGHGCFIPPNTAAWRTDSVNIAVVTGKPSVMFSFESRSGWGNILYLDNINITDNLTTGIVEHYLTRDVRVYPNPNNGSFNIALTGKAHVWVYNLLGQPVFDSPLVSGANSISLESGAGIYFYSIRSENGKERISEGKVIVQ